MKKYRLIKQYPNSPEIGFILEPSNKYGHNGYVYNGFPINTEKYTEFWKEVVEKDYEILYVFLEYGGLGVVINGKHNGILAEEYKIQSIRRLFDGEIFTIGDRIEDDEHSVIQEFELIDNILKVWCVNPAYSCPRKPQSNGSITGCGNMFYYLLKDIEHFKKPLFKTEDGVEIDLKSQEQFYFIPKNNFNINSIMICNYWCNENCKKGEIPKQFKNLYFSTKEKAEEYVLMNKPCLSINDVLTSQDGLLFAEKKLKELVKLKINDKT